MLKVGSYVLAALLLFALVLALLPVSTPQAETGAVLSGVRLTLYPASDPDAYWTFNAQKVSNDPIKGETHLAALDSGGRWLLQRDAEGQLAGQPTLDATIKADDLTIDAQDNMTTGAAQITLVRECAAVDLTGNKQQPVRVEQNVGFSAPLAQLDSPALTGEVKDMQMTFGFEILQSSQDSSFGWNMNATEQCVNGKRQPI